MSGSRRPEEVERDLARLRGAVDQIADQLCWAVDGRLDFAVRASCADDTVEKLAMLVNFLLDAARRAVDAVEERNHRLVELDRAKARFFANVSHELRTPLTLIQGPVEVLIARAQEQGDTVAVESLRRVRRNADRLAGVVEDLLDAARLDAGAARAVARPVDPAGIVRSVVDDAQESARARGVALTVDAPPGGEPIALDPEKFEKIVLNLVSNALKFTPAGGSVAVSVARYGGTVGLRVADTGPGIRAEDQERLFQRFSQVDASATRRYEGTGLGLAIVREFAELMGGTAGVESAPGRGSTFWVELPAREIVGATPAAPAPRATPAFPPPPPPVPAAVVADGREVIVVAEDNPDLLAYLREQLAPSYSVHPAKDGLEALELVRTLRPSLLLSDVMMPGLDGLELTRRIKADPDLRDVPIVLVTARGGDEAVAEGLEAGAEDYLCKPFGRLTLFARVRAALRTRRLAEEVARTHAERAARERLAFVADAGRLLAAPLVAEGRLQELAELLVDRVSEGCAVWVRHGQGIARRAEAVRPGSPWRDLGVPSLEEAVREVAASGQPLRLGPAEVPELRPAAVTLYPLPGGEGTRGVLVCVYQAAVPPDEALLAGGIAHRVGVALETAALYAQARAAEERYRGLVESLDAVVWEADPAGEVCTFVNRRGVALLGFDLDAWRAPGFMRSLLHPDDRPRFDAALLADAPARSRFRLRTASCEWRTMQGTIERVGADRALRGVLLDVTDARRAEEALREREARLLQAEKLESLGRLAGEIAHDFNNVLAAIVGYARLIERKADETDAVRRHARGIRAASDRASTLIGQLLQFSRRRSGGPVPVDVAAATEQMLDMLSHLVGEGTRVRLDVARPIPPVLLPRGQIEQVLLNLVVNARDAMPGGGQVEITVRAPEPGWVEIVVRDEGTGMDAATLERLFEPFFTTKPEGQGTGLGLPTVHAIVTKAGGRVEVESEPGEGALFRILLPALVPPPPPEPLPPRPRVRGPARGRHVLLVEDEAPLRGILAEALEEAGYRVTSAGNADEALLAAGQDAVDVVVSDIVIPGMSGFELAGRLHALYPRVRFVYMSGFAGGAPSPPDRPPGPLLHKPFSPQLLARAVGLVCQELREETV